MQIITVETTIQASTEKVWAAIIEPESVKAIFMGAVIESSFKVGEPIAYVGPGVDGERTTHVYGKILAFEPERKFSLTHYAGTSYHPQAANYESRIIYTLTPDAESTKVTLVHDQWIDGDPSYEGSKQAWPFLMQQLKSLVETGEVADLNN